MKIDWRNMIRYVFRFLMCALLVVLLCLVRSFFPQQIPFRLTITTSVYATLITILLALLTLAITAFIFLSTALKERREPFEQETIHTMLSVRTRTLIWLTLGGIVCLFACFFLDNADADFLQSPTVFIVVALLSTAVGFFLLWYTWHIINYESDLKHYAKKSREKLYGRKDSAPGQENTSSVFKLIGDLELLVNQLLHNHKNNFHRVDSAETLKTVTSEQFAGMYKNLIHYRDFLRVEELETVDAGTWACVHEDIKKLENELRGQYLKGERLRNLGFVHPFLEQGDKRFCLKGTIFTQSAFEQVNLAGAQLKGADFSQTRLNELNLQGADCTEAVFSGSVWKDVKVDAACSFRQAVFQDADLGRQKFCAKPGELFRFQDATFLGANLLECIFHNADLRFTNFQNALLTRGELHTVCLSYATLRGAILTGIKLRFVPGERYPFPPQEYWQPSQLDKAENPLPSYEMNWKGKNLGPAFFINLERSALTQACISCYNFAGSRFAQANLSDTLLKYCIFDRCSGQRATFQEATIQNCRFEHAILNGADFSHAQISDCDFSDASLRESLIIQAVISSSNEGELSHFLRTNFTNSLLRGCTFIGCDFTDALFVDADLTGACFKECILTGAKFDGAFIDHVRWEECTDGPPLSKLSRKDEPEREECNQTESDVGKSAKLETGLPVQEAIFTRRSTRAFQPSRTINGEKIKRIMCAALQAPSPKNRQPWQFTVIEDQNVRYELAAILENALERLRGERLKRGCDTSDLDLAHGSVRVMHDAPVLVFVSYDRDVGNEHGDPHNWTLSAQPFETGDLQAIGAAVQNMLLTAVSEGVDSLWMGDVLYAYQELMEHLKLQNPFVAAVALGYHAQHSTPRKSLGEKVSIWKQTSKQSP